MNGKLMLYLDQYGRPYWSKTVKELREKVGGGRISTMYVDKKDGSTARVGYVIGRLWSFAVSSGGVAKMTREIWNNEDVIDSRDVIERIKDLEEELETQDMGELDIAELNEELLPLKKLAEQGEDTASDWHWGEALIRDSYFEDYAYELAQDIGALNKECQWPHTCIDWKQAAEELQQDYCSIDFDGVTYWIRG